MSKLDALLAKEVSRRSFLIMIGSAITGILGISSLLGLLSQNDTKPKTPVEYGMKNYGP